MPKKALLIAGVLLAARSDGNGKITEADLPPMLRGRGFLK
jgi:hypothetical protein